MESISERSFLDFMQRHRWGFFAILFIVIAVTLLTNTFYVSMIIIMSVSCVLLVVINIFNLCKGSTRRYYAQTLNDSSVQGNVRRHSSPDSNIYFVAGQNNDGTRAFHPDSNRPQLDNSQLNPGGFLNTSASNPQEVLLQPTDLRLSCDSDVPSYYSLFSDVEKIPQNLSSGDEAPSIPQSFNSGDDATPIPQNPSLGDEAPPSYYEAMRMT